MKIDFWTLLLQAINLAVLLGLLRWRSIQVGPVRAELGGELQEGREDRCDAGGFVALADLGAVRIAVVGRGDAVQR